MTLKRRVVAESPTSFVARGVRRAPVGWNHGQPILEPGAERVGGLPTGRSA